MTRIEKYKRFLDEIGWDEFNNVEKSYFFDDLNVKQNEKGIILQILSCDKKKDNIVIRHSDSGAELEIQQKKLSEFRKWLEDTYANGEDGATYFELKEIMAEPEPFSDTDEAQGNVRDEEEIIESKAKDEQANALNVNIEELARAVYLWLNYQTTVSSSVNLLHEASFRYPVAEFLERKLHSDLVILEEDHPVFNNRPTDFQWTLNKKQFYLECKFVKTDYTNRKSEFQRYVDDLCRLYYCIKDGQNRVCYFLVCGHKTDFENCLLQVETEEEQKRNINKRRYNQILGFKKDGVKEISFSSTYFKDDSGFSEEEKVINSLNEAYNHFLKDYEDNVPPDKKEMCRLEKEINLTVKCLYMPRLDDNEYVYIWQVQEGRLERIEDKPLI